MVVGARSPSKYTTKTHIFEPLAPALTKRVQDKKNSNLSSLNADTNEWKLDYLKYTNRIYFFLGITKLVIYVRGKDSSYILNLV